MVTSICVHTVTEVQNVTLFLHRKKEICGQNSPKNDGIVVNWKNVGVNGVSMSSEASILFLQAVHQLESFSRSYCGWTTSGILSSTSV